jgi:hypothetical protein
MTIIEELIRITNDLEERIKICNLIKERNTDVTTIDVCNTEILKLQNQIAGLETAIGVVARMDCMFNLNKREGD